MLVEFHWVVRHDRLPFLSLGNMGCVRVQRVDEEIAAQPQQSGCYTPHTICHGVGGMFAGRALTALVYNLSRVLNIVGLLGRSEA
jgi:hypothetical protein